MTKKIKKPLLEGVKYDNNKLRMNLLNLNHLDEMVKVLMFGSEKYDDNNWMKVAQAKERYFEASIRHLKAIQEDGGIINLNSIDNESGYSHLAHAMCCLYFLEYFRRKEVEK